MDYQQVMTHYVGREDSSANDEGIEMLRWICVLPVAVLCKVGIAFITGVMATIFRQAGWLTPDATGPVYLAWLLIAYVPKEVGFVVAGAKTAPRHRLATAIVLSVLAILASLLKHVVMQSQPGWVNYTHFAAESAGAVCGLVLILCDGFLRGRRRASVS